MNNTAHYSAMTAVAQLISNTDNNVVEFIMRQLAKVFKTV